MNIRKLRENRQLKQDELAKEMLVNKTTVCKWETGKSQPRADMLPKLARVLGCSIDDLFGDQDDETKAG